jgi:hypothetical protein
MESQDLSWKNQTKVWIPSFILHHDPIMIMEKMMKDTDILESHIREKQKIVDYDVKDSTVALLVQRYTQGLEESKNNIYIPDYQGALVWDEEKQSKVCGICPFFSFPNSVGECLPRRSASNI